MTKSLVTRLFVGAIVAVVTGIVVCIVGFFAAAAGGTFIWEGNDLTGFNPSAFSWSMIALMVLGGLAIVGGAAVGLIAWIGALLNTSRLEDKTWFVLLLILGIFSLGFIAMIAYVIAGPDGTVDDAHLAAHG